MTTLNKALKTLQGLNRPVVLFLIGGVMYGTYFSIRMLFFNLYILELGFDREFLVQASVSVRREERGYFSHEFVDGTGWYACGRV